MHLLVSGLAMLDEKTSGLGFHVMSSLSLLIASFCGFSKEKMASFSRRLLSGAVRSERFGMNFPKYVITPKKR